MPGPQTLAERRHVEPPEQDPTRSVRLPFVDLARAVAVLFMVQGHALSVLLAPQYAGGPFGHAWLYLRGLTSCTFLILSGFSFSLATMRRWPEFQTPGRRVYRRLARYAVLLILGYGMRFPARSLSELSTIPPAQWQSFAVVDVLQLIAVTLTALQVAVWLIGSPRAFIAWSMAAATATVFVTPVVVQAGWLTTAPIFLHAYLTTATGSLFPALPWAAYVFFGAGLGGWYARRQRGHAADDGARALLLAGLGMVAAGAALHAMPWSPFGAIDFWSVSPNLFLVKTGSVLAGLAAAIRLVRGVKGLPRVVGALSRESLLVYLAHVVLLYGSAWTVGVSQRVGAQLGPVPVLLWIVGLLTAMSLLAWAWHEGKRRLSSLVSSLRAMAARSAQPAASRQPLQGSERLPSIQVS